MRQVHLTPEEVGILISVVGGAIADGIVQPEKYLGDEIKSVLYKVKSLKNGERYHLTVSK